MRRKKNKLNSIDPEPLRSPTPSIALSGVSTNSKLDDISIQEQLSVFYFGQNESGKSASGRRYSHPNQLKWVEEYDNQRRASATSTTLIPVIDVTPSKSSSPPPSPVMMFPVIPPGRLL
ncbi:hypothetical protein Ocin01_14600 [Orchesella cincta]|uniref:Uncharacterized protein n=1 Tax=Orchesella cincta TaxID=48709 RepID=A0A1D2MGP4_ORCCI|nr:hypothetical protein Ocin01_14600 [Orchesella cincta]